jgi:SAM-dependent methyltransferase
MNAASAIPYGRALLAYFEGDHDAELLLRRDDGLESIIPVRYFFREEADFSILERTAIDQCNGTVLDVGAGTGLHSLSLAARGLKVNAIDISPEAVEIMKRRGMRSSRQSDVFNYRSGPFDTVIMLGHGIGITEDLSGLSRFLEFTHQLVRPDGQMILDSLDVSCSQNPADHAYHDSCRKAGRYIGEINMQFEFQGHCGPYCSWLHIDREVLENLARQANWNCETLVELENGEYLARLKPKF